MSIEFDAAKSQKNRNDPSRGFGLELAANFQWEDCVTFPDKRKDYGERRMVSIGFIGKRLHVVVWTRRAKTLRIISLRKANPRKVTFYETQKRD